MVAVLATFFLWVVGLATRARQWTRHFQANTERRRNVLSTVFLGRELLRNQRLILTYDELVNSLEWLARLLQEQGSLA